MMNYVMASQRARAAGRGSSSKARKHRKTKKRHAISPRRAQIAQWTTPDFSHNGQPLPYNSSYFLHLEAVKPNEAEITILGYDSNITRGQRWSVVGDMFVAPPHRIDNIVFMRPSPTDKRAMLNIILGLLK